MLTTGDTIHLNTEAERLLAVLGGANPQQQTFVNDELGEVLAEAIEKLAEANSPILDKIMDENEAARRGE